MPRTFEFLLLYSAFCLVLLFLVLFVSFLMSPFSFLASGRELRKLPQFLFFLPAILILLIYLLVSIVFTNVILSAAFLFLFFGHPAIWIFWSGLLAFVAFAFITHFDYLREVQRIFKFQLAVFCANIGLCVFFLIIHRFHPVQPITLFMPALIFLGSIYCIRLRIKNMSIRYPDENPPTLGDQEFKGALEEWQMMPGIRYNLIEQASKEAILKGRSINQSFESGAFRMSEKQRRAAVEREKDKSEMAMWEDLGALDIDRKMMRLTELYDGADARQRGTLEWIAKSEGCFSPLLSFTYRLGPQIESPEDVKYLRFAIHALRLSEYQETLDFRDLYGFTEAFKVLMYFVRKAHIDHYRIFSEKIKVAPPNLKRLLRGARDSTTNEIYYQINKHGPPEIREQLFAKHPVRMAFIRFFNRSTSL